MHETLQLFSCLSYEFSPLLFLKNLFLESECWVVFQFQGAYTDNMKIK